MLPSLKQLSVSNPIVNTKIIDKTLFIIDNQNLLYKIDLTRLKIIQTTQLFKPETKNFDYHKKNSSMSLDQKIFISSKKTHTGYILDAQEKIQKVCNFKYSDYDITQSKFSYDNKLLLLCDEKGRSYVVDAKDGSLLFELSRVGDAISSIDISKDNELCAIGNFSGKVIIANLQTGTKVLSLKEESPIEALKFVNYHELIIACRDNQVIRYDIEKNQELSRVILETQNDWISFIYATFEDKVLLLGTRDSKLITLHTKTLKPIFDLSLAQDGITSIQKSEDYFIFTFKSANVIFFNYRENEEKFVQYIDLLDIKAASLLLKDNIFLIAHEKNRKIYDDWLEKKEVITLYLSTSKIKEANEIAKPYLYHPKCQQEFELLERNGSKLTLLSDFIESKSYEQAYEILQNSPELETTIFYKRLEFLWDLAFQKALDELYIDPILNIEVAKNILSDFENVPTKKLLIDELLKNSSAFIEAQNAIKQKDFAKYFRLIQNYSFLKQTLLYQKVIKLTNELEQTTVDFIKNSDFNKATQIATILENFTPVTNSAIRFKEIIQALSQIQNALNSKDLHKALSLEFELDIAGDYPPLISLKNSINSLINRLEVEIQNNKIENTFVECLKLLEHFQTKQRAKMLIKKLYIKQIKQSAFILDWETTLNNYIKFFSIDTPLLEILKEHEKESLLETLKTVDTKSEKYIETIVSKIDIN